MVVTFLQAEERLAADGDPDMQRKVLHLRRLIIMLGDVFQAERDYRAQSTAASMSMDKQEHLQQTMKLINFAKDAWMYVQQILSDGDELSVSTVRDDCANGTDGWLLICICFADSVGRSVY
jgi:hypothetical protein